MRPGSKAWQEHGFGSNGLCQGLLHLSASGSKEKSGPEQGITVTSNLYLPEPISSPSS